jgi:dihydroflavonol-4-reductase
MGDLILVTGATGFLGHNLVTHLVRADYAVRALVRPLSNWQYLRDLGVDLAWGDVREVDSVQKAVEGCRFVVHGAGLFRFWGKPREFERTNVHGAGNVMEAARRAGVEKVAHISTIAIMGNPPRGMVIDESTPPQPSDAYQQSKWDGEKLVRQYFEHTRLPVVILRPGAFYGLWGHYAFNRLFFEDPLKGLRIEVHRGQRYTFPIFVPDLARAIESALRLGRPGEVYNVSGESLTHREANRIISRLAGISPLRVNVPGWAMVALAGAWTRLAELTGREPYYPLSLRGYVFNDWRVSSAKAQAELGFTATPFEDGARQTLEWYWESGMFKRPNK